MDERRLTLELLMLPPVPRQRVDAIEMAAQKIHEGITDLLAEVEQLTSLDAIHRAWLNARLLEVELAELTNRIAHHADAVSTELLGGVTWRS